MKRQADNSYYGLPIEAYEEEALKDISHAMVPFYKSSICSAEEKGTIQPSDQRWVNATDNEVVEGHVRRAILEIDYYEYLKRNSTPESKDWYMAELKYIMQKNCIKRLATRVFI